MKLSSPDWRKMTDADREKVRQFIEAGLIKTLARANGVSVRTVNGWRIQAGKVVKTTEG